ncbi:MAG: GTPase [Flavobacteriales bacterium]|nr:GTPase [Flavobacteriales bacterium]
MERTLIFVYNAQNDAFNALVDYAHKLFKPSTYKCELCALTHHNFGERKTWKEFKEHSEVEMEFRYIRQFENEFNLRLTYPVIVIRRDGQLEEFMTKSEMSQLNSVEELTKELEKRLKE